jgi:hypothetical protein
MQNHYVTLQKKSSNRLKKGRHRYEKNKVGELVILIQRNCPDKAFRGTIRKKLCFAHNF